MTEFFAGHILQGVAKSIESSVDKNYWLEIATNLSKFYCQNPTINNADNETEHPIFSVLDNQISRGLPTISSIFIERAFEISNDENESKDVNIFNGLMAVIDVLDRIHENKEELITKASKARFIHKPQEI